VGVHCGIYKSSYNTWNITYSNSPRPPRTLLCPPLPIPGMVSTGLIFPFTSMCTQYLHHSHPPTPFPHLLPLCTDNHPSPPTHPGRTCSVLRETFAWHETHRQPYSRELYFFIFFKVTVFVQEQKEWIEKDWKLKNIQRLLSQIWRKPVTAMGNCVYVVLSLSLL
jgi:hypothetical protein